MKHIFSLVICCTLALAAASAFGHGHPIHLEQHDNQLVVSQGVADPNGFASQIFVETDSGGDPEDVANFNGFGMAAYWTIPGYDIYGLAENSGLYLEVLSRPVKDATPPEKRLLWYWNPDTQEVELAPDTQLQIRHSASVNILLTPETIVAPPPLRIAAPLADEMGFHNHNLVRYLLPFPLPQAGAYGFFARLTSDVYEPSDPFLVVLNNGVEYEQMTDAALAINLAAIDSLPGDFNFDGTVDAADYTIWRNENLGPEKYAEWKSHFGESSGDPSGGGQGAAVPEPASAALAFISSLAALAVRRRTTPFPLARAPRQSFAGTPPKHRV
jgi:hypothetical protein